MELRVGPYVRFACLSLGAMASVCGMVGASGEGGVFDPSRS
jgi:hypothetical protein